MVCETPAFKGNDLIEVRVQYAHPWPSATPYAVRLGPLHFEDDATVVIRGQGHPNECVWRFTIIFRDGFESGDDSQWSRTEP